MIKNVEVLLVQWYFLHRNLIYNSVFTEDWLKLSKYLMGSPRMISYTKLEKVEVEGWGWGEGEVKGKGTENQCLNRFWLQVKEWWEEERETSSAPYIHRPGRLPRVQDHFKITSDLNSDHVTWSRHQNNKQKQYHLVNHRLKDNRYWMTACCQSREGSTDTSYDSWVLAEECVGRLRSDRWKIGGRSTVDKEPKICREQREEE